MSSKSPVPAALPSVFVTTTTVLIGACTVLLLMVLVVLVCDIAFYTEDAKLFTQSTPDETFLLHVNDPSQPGRLRDVQTTANASSLFKLQPSAMLITAQNDIQGLAEADIADLHAINTLTATTVFAQSITVGLQTGPFSYRMPLGPRVDGDCAQTNDFEQQLIWAQPLPVLPTDFAHVSNYGLNTLSFLNSNVATVSVVPFDSLDGPSFDTTIRRYASANGDISFIVPPVLAGQNQPVSIVFNRSGLFWTTMALQFQPDFAVMASAGWPQIYFAFASVQPVPWSPNLYASVIHKTVPQRFQAGTTLTGFITATSDSTLTGDFGLVSWSIDMVSIALSDS